MLALAAFLFVITAPAEKTKAADTPKGDKIGFIYPAVEINGEAIPAWIAAGDLTDGETGVTVPAGTNIPGWSWSERKAFYYFRDNFTGEGKNGVLIPTYDVSKINVDDLKCVWIHIDRKDLQKGWRQLPGEFTDASLIRNLYTFMKYGGNIYFSGHATQLVNAIWRIHSNYAVNEFNSRRSNDDSWEFPSGTWGIRTDYNLNGFQHPIFKGLNSFVVDQPSTFLGEPNVFGLLGDGGNLFRENHNSLWVLDRYNYVTDPRNDKGLYDYSRSFEMDNNASILASHHWDYHNSDSYNQSDYRLCAGIVEFHPIEVTVPGTNNKIQSGTVICNGIAAAQWDVFPDENRMEWTQNLHTLTSNILGYLSTGQPTVTGNQPACPPTSASGTDETIESTGLIAMYIDFEGDAYSYLDAYNKGDVDEFEYAAYKYFVDNFVNNTEYHNRYGNRKPEVVFKQDYKKLVFCGQENVYPGVEGFECVWVNIDRDGSPMYEGYEIGQNDNGTDYTPSYKDLKKIYLTGKDGDTSNVDYLGELVTVLKKFREDGGNLYLSKWGSLLLKGIDDSYIAQNQVTSFPKNGKEEADDWMLSFQPDPDNADYTQADHPIFSGMADGRKVHLLSGSYSGTLRDMNCVWRLHNEHFSNTWYIDKDREDVKFDWNANRRLGCIYKFNELNNARILGVWGHEEENAYTTAGLVEFMPKRNAAKGPSRITSISNVIARRGTIITNGLGTYEWEAMNMESDLDDTNVRRLTGNILAYLTPVAESAPDDVMTEIEEIDDDDQAAAVYYNLQGVKVDNPSNGIFIEVKGKKARKVVK